MNGIRLDSIDVQYATIGWRTNQTVIFDYGQYRDGKKGLTVTDAKNLPLEFKV